MKPLLLVFLTALPCRAASGGQESWSDNRLTKLEVKADKELADIQKRIENGDLPKVQFDLDSAVIQPQSYNALDVIADLMLRYPDLKIKVTAHTCNLGSAEYNMTLSQKRAKSVKAYLVKQGVPPPSIRFKGMSLTAPRADNATEEGRVQNRRVEFRLVPRDWDSVY